jgi:hypothetical protein
MAVPSPPKHANEYEHTDSIIKFFGTYIFYGLLGGVIGRAIDKLVADIQKGRTDRWYSLWFLTLQILLNGIVFYALFKLVSIKSGKLSFTVTDESIRFDDWIGGTFQGLIFGTTIYAAQDQLPYNLKRIF